MLEVQRTNTGSSSSFSPSNSQARPHAPPTTTMTSSAPSGGANKPTQAQQFSLVAPAPAGLPGPIMAPSSSSQQPAPNNNQNVSLTYASLDQTINNNGGLNGSSQQQQQPTSSTSLVHASAFQQQQQQHPHHHQQHPHANPQLPPPTRESVLQRLSEALLRRSLAKIDLSQKGLSSQDARLVKMALLQNRQLRVLKLGYNQLGDAGVEILVQGLSQHSYLQSLDLGFNNIGDVGCQALATAIGAPDSESVLSTLYLAGNCIGQDGAMALADVITSRHVVAATGAAAVVAALAMGGSAGDIHNNEASANTAAGGDAAAATSSGKKSKNGSTLQRLYMTGNRLGPDGVKAITEAILQDAAMYRDEFGDHGHDDDDDDDSLMGATIMINHPTTTDSTRTATSMFEAMDTSVDESASQRQQQQQVAATSTTATTSAATSAALSGRGIIAASSSFPSPKDHPPPLMTSSPTASGSKARGMQELFLGGTSLGAAGCQAVARLLASPDCRLKVLSLANCNISDEDLIRSDGGLAPSIKRNRDGLVLSSLQLSFNEITHKGLEALMNALWGSKTIKELRLDNNDIGDRGAQQLAAILPYLKTLETLDVGFNNINNKNQGMKILMKAVAETNNLTTLSLSGNPMQDVSSAKAVAYALAYNCSLQSLLLVHCQLTTEGQRHVAAGAVSNSRTSLRELSGFPVGPVIVTLGFPDALEHWTNVQVLNFIHMMWNKNKPFSDSGKEEEEKGLDPLNFLPGSSNQDNKVPRRGGPLEATIVVDVARKAFASLVANGVDVFSRRPGHPKANASPAVFAPRDAIMLESVDGDSIVESMGEVAVSSSPRASSNNLNGAQSPPRPPMPMSSANKSSNQARSFVAPPQERDAGKQSQLPDPSRKKRIVEWLCSNIKHLNKLSQMPFDSGELLKLHQHYFTPVVNESGGTSAFKHGDGGTTASSSVPNVSRDSSNNHHFEDASSPSLASSTTTFQSSDVSMVPASDPMFTVGTQQPHSQQRPQQRSSQPQVAGSSLPMLKRKVSYRFLGDAAMHQPNLPAPQRPASSWGSAFGSGSSTLGSVAKMISDGPSGHSLPPKNKKARRNRTRISFLPRIKAKLDSYLDVCHEKALITMRQLYYVEQAILNGRVNPLDPNSPRTHLSGALATDAETIVVDMI